MSVHHNGEGRPGAWVYLPDGISEKETAQWNPGELGVISAEKKGLQAKATTSTRPCGWS